MSREILKILQDEFPGLTDKSGTPVSERIAKAVVPKVQASEALFGFAAWLTCRDDAVVFSAKHDASVAAEMVGTYCEENDLPEPREGWQHNLSMPAQVR